MASFYSWMLPTKRRWKRIVAGYQDLHDDSGNWTSGKVGIGENIGTNRSVAAYTLADWRGTTVTKEDMMNLSIVEAMSIYKAFFWNKIQGDNITSQALADILADMKSSAGGNAIKEMQKTLNSLGENLPVDGSWGNASLEALNRQTQKVGEAKIFNAFRENMIAYYKRLNSRFENQWINSLNEDYPPMQERSWFEKNWFPVVVGGIAVVILIYILKNKKAKRK